jgi:tetratricopeptide (TPR) repeat protein
MKRLLVIAVLLLSGNIFAQDVSTLLKEASNLERSLKDDQALEKYRSILSADPSNLQALVRGSEISCAIGARQTDKKAKQDYYERAKDYADKALTINANSADANYVRAVVAGKLTEVETDNKKLVANVKDTKTFADKALSIDPNHGKANYVLGKWNYEMLTLPWTKKAAIKVLFGGMPEASIENAFKYMEKCKTLEPYFVLNFLDLAKAYKYDNQPAKAIAVLNQLVKLPTRTADDAALKNEGKKLLSEMQ